MSRTHTVGIITSVLVLISKGLFVSTLCAATMRISPPSVEPGSDTNPLITHRINPFTVLHPGTSYEYCDLIHTENGIEKENAYLNRRRSFHQTALFNTTLTEAELEDMAQTEPDTERNRKRVGDRGLFIESRDRAEPQRG
ncbi:MAG: hypothetical protein JSV52_07965 [Candidatus Zixiibacteriota bacterium]|nr:MAG: hypothetical protein JSV52_07965 [candidate division Zixibacteria bacterium]